MAFFNSAVGVLQTLVVALGAGLGIWGAKFHGDPDRDGDFSGFDHGRDWSSRGRITDGK